MSNNLGISQVASNQNNKEVTINDMGIELGEALTELLAVDVTSGNATVSSSDYQRNMAVSVTCTVASRTVTLPAVKRPVLVISPASNTQDFGLVRGATTLAVSPGDTVLAYTDGTDDGLYAVTGGGGGGGGDGGAGWHLPVRVATVAAGTLSSSFENGDTVDGVVLATGDRILIKDQASPAENGVYVVAASGAPARADDADADGELVSGSAVYVSQGTVNGGRIFFLSTHDPITVGSTSLTWAQQQSSLPTSDWHQSVRVATTANGTMSLSFENGDTVDGVVLATGDRILIKSQTSAVENGIYVVAASGSPARAADADTDGDLTSGSAVYVSEGTKNAGQVFVLSTADPITVGSTAQTWTSINPVGSRPYDIGGFYGGTPATNTIVLRFVAPRAFTLPSGLASSRGYVGTQPSANTDFDLRKNGSSIGTMGFTNGSNTATFTFSADVSFAAGDRLDIVSPASTLNGLADVAYTLAGLR